MEHGQVDRKKRPRQQEQEPPTGAKMQKKKHPPNTPKTPELRGGKRDIVKKVYAGQTEPDFSKSRKKKKQQRRREDMVKIKKTRGGPAPSEGIYMKNRALEKRVFIEEVPQKKIDQKKRVKFQWGDVGGTGCTNAGLWVGNSN